MATERNKLRTITAVKRTARDPNRCSVFVNDQFFVACAADIVLSLGLKRGLELTRELEELLLTKERGMALRQKAYHFAMYKPRTEKNVKDYLRTKHNAAIEEVESIVEWLKSFNVVDDVEFTRRFIESSHERKPLSQNSVRKKLLEKGISREIVDNALQSMHSEEDEFTAALAVAEKKMKTLKSDKNVNIDHLTRFLAGRGYRWEIIKRVLRTLTVLFILNSPISIFNSPLSDLKSQTLSCNKVRLNECINRFQPATQPVVAPDGSLFIDRKLHPDNTEGPSDPDEVWICPPDDPRQWSDPILSKFTTFARPDVVFNFTADGLSALVVGPYNRSSGITRKSFAIIHRKSVTIPFTEVNNIYLPGADTLGKNFYGFLTDNRRTLILAMELEGGMGDLDLYVSKECNGKWSKPETLGKAINTPSFEGAPWLSHDGQTLYFSSSGREDRRGKTDLYRARLDLEKRTVVSQPINLGPCMNTAEDETSFSLIGKGDTALITSWDAACGRPGIYTTVLDEAIKSLPWCKFTGTVTDAITGEPIKLATIVVQDSVLADRCSDDEYYTDTASGTFTIALPTNKQYRILTKADGYVTHKQTIGIKTLDSVVTLHLTTELFNKNKPLYSIYFERGEYTVSDVQAQEIAEFAKKFDVRQLAFEVSGYTDQIGTIPFNETLSSKRAEVVKDLIINSGISRSRVIATGRGIDPSSRFSGEPENAQSRRVDVFAAE